MVIDLLRHRRFGAFFWTQFLGAFNDNLLKFAVTLAVTYNEALRGSWSTGILVNLIAGLFILPFVLLSATSGQLADKHDKTRVMRLAKWLEPPIVLITTAGFALNHVELLVAGVFLLGAQSAFFGPAKYAYLPDHLQPRELVMGNALVESATFMAILLGTIAAGSLMSAGSDPAVVYWVCGFAFLVSVAGVVSSHLMPQTPPYAPDLKVNWNLFTESVRNVAFARRLTTVWPSLLGISWLWFVGATYLTQFPLLAQSVFNANAGVATVLLFAFTLGLGGGAFLCERLSHKRVEMGLVFWGLLTMLLVGLCLHAVLTGYATPSSVQDVPTFFATPINWWVLGLFVCMSVGVGLYSVPLYSSMQAWSPKESRSRVVAANNIVNSLFMVVSAGFAIAVLLVTGGQVVWVITGVTLINAVVLGLWVRRSPHLFLRAVLLWKVPGRKLPQLDEQPALFEPVGRLVVVPTLLHENYAERLLSLPVRCTVTLSGRLPGSRWVNWLRKHDFVWEVSHFTDEKTQKDVIRQLAQRMQKGQCVAIDRPMFELLRQQYRLNDMPALLAKSGIVMTVLEVSETRAGEGDATLGLTWRLNLSDRRQDRQPASGI
ncbi:MAG: MFS transporter [Limnobacter sp.]|uniref:MFS transporter n=2 Tax=Pseudomonadota TaxID=1224 RepID=UPI00391DA391